MALMFPVRSLALAFTMLAGFIPFTARANFQQPEALVGARLYAIANAIAKDDPSSISLMTEAMSLCGVSLWSEDRAVLAEPRGPKLGLAVTDSEIKEFLDMYKQGHSVKLVDLCASFDVLLNKLDVQESSLVYIRNWLLTGTGNKKPGVRVLTLFIQDLAQTHEKTSDEWFDDSTVLDPLEALLIIRVFTEEIANPIRKIKAGSNFVNLMHLSPVEGAQGAVPEGWSEDAFVSGVTGIIGKIREAALKTKSVGEKIGKAYEVAGAASTIAKAVATYTFLKGEITVKGQGQPLVRTMDTSSGESRPLSAKFIIDGSKVTDWMKDHRQLVALAGLDIDMPKTGPLTGIETNWEIFEAAGQYDFNNHIVKWATGSGDVSKVKTNDNGEANVTIEGAAQKQKFDPKAVRPLMKSVTVKVTPQAKGTEIKQDLLDAVTGAIGIKEGPVGFLTPVIESLYRMKWKGGTKLKLAVKDWESTKTIMHLTVDVKGTASNYQSDGTSFSGNIDRHLEVTNMLVEVMEPTALPEIPAEALKFLSEKDKAALLESMKKQAGGPQIRQFSPKGPGDVVMSINDRTFQRIVDVGCERTGFTDVLTTLVGHTSFSYQTAGLKESDLFTVQLIQELGNKPGAVLIAAGSPTHARTEVRGPNAPVKNEDKDSFDTLFTGLEIVNGESSGTFKFDLKEESVGDHTELHGAGTVKFRFGPSQKFEGTIIFSVLISKPLVKKK